MFAHRSALRLGLEAFAILLVLGVAGVTILVVTRQSHPPPRNGRPVGGPQVDVSRARLAQVQPAVAADPRRPGLLLAGSLDRRVGTRVYLSRDRGRTWVSQPGPALPFPSCERNDPTVAIDGSGREYYALTTSSLCVPVVSRLTLATRAGPRAPWQARLLFPAPGSLARPTLDQAPSLAVDLRRGRIYLLWTRVIQRFARTSIVSRPELRVAHSDDGGRSWSTPRRVPARLPSLGRAVVGRNGDLYVVLADAGSARVELLRSRDGGAGFATARRVDVLREPYRPGCGPGSAAVAAQPQRCIGPAPTLLVDRRGNVVVVYAEPEADGTEAVWSAAYTPSLRELHGPVRVGPADAGRADQFTPVAALDRSDGSLWACYYDTTGDRQRTRTWFTCTASRDGGLTWARPVRAAAQLSDETTVAADPSGYGDGAGLVADGGVAYPLWTDTRRFALDEEIFASAIPLRRLLRAGPAW
jgi:hypothetical protein